MRLRRRKWYGPGLQQDIEELGKTIMGLPGEPSQSESAPEAANRILQRYATAMDEALHELGVPGPGYPAPVANAVAILRGAYRYEAGNKTKASP
jgi:hypothetical protein